MRISRPLETPGANAAAVASALLIAQQVAGKAARDALFLSSYAASYLPIAMAIGAVLSLLGVHALSRVMLRTPPAKVVPRLLVLSAAGFAVEWLLGFRSAHVASALLYAQTAVLGPVLLSAFWSLINERFDPHTAKRAVARIAAGGTLGGVLGGLIVWRASTVVHPHVVLLLLALMSAAGVVAIWVARAQVKLTVVEPEAPVTAAKELSALTELKAAPFLRNLAILVALGAATSAILDYVFSVQAVAVYGKGQALLSFFALFWLGVAVLSFVLQTALAKVALEKLGLAISIAVMPGLILLGGALGLAVPGLLSSLLLRGAEAVQRNTLFRSAYELLYTPLSEDRKRVTKVLIDVGFDRFGTVLGSGVLLLAGWQFGHHAWQVMLGVVVVFALATLPVVLRIHRGYVEALQEALRESAAKLEAADKAAATRAPEAPGRETLIGRIEELRPGGLSALLEEGLTPSVAPPPPPAAPPPPAQDRHVALRLLGDLKPRSPAIASAIQLLGRPDVHQQAQRALGAIAPAITGQLLDSLLDTTTDFMIRRRIARVLRRAPTQRTAEGLLLGIADERFEVRYECGRALLAVTDANPQLVISQSAVLAAVQREIEHGLRMLEQLNAQFEDDDPNDDETSSSLMGDLVRDRVNRGLEHVFTVLSLHLEREPLRLAFHALHHDDDKFRGTALEYLDTVLPVEIRDLVWPLLGATAPLPTARPARDLLEDLALARASATASPGNGIPFATISRSRHGNQNESQPEREDH